MKRYAFLLLFAALALSNCTPADEQYCRSFGVGGTEDFGKCMAYYHTQEQAFNADLAVCNIQADATYPRTLYDTGRYETVMGGAFWAGRYEPGAQEAFVPPDYAHNAQLDALRARIIQPCMTAHGWNSTQSWQAGKHAVTAPVSTPVGATAALPWLK